MGDTKGDNALVYFAYQKSTLSVHVRLHCQLVVFVCARSIQPTYVFVAILKLRLCQYFHGTMASQSWGQRLARERERGEEKRQRSRRENRERRKRKRK